MLMNLISALALLLACIILSSHMSRHVKGVIGFQPSTAQLRWLGRLGWSLLCGSLWVPIHTHGVAIGVLVWFGLLTIAAVGVALLQSYKPSLLRSLAPLTLLFITIATGGILFTQ